MEVRGLEFREKLIGLKKLQHLALGGGHLTGVQWLRFHLELLAVFPRHKGGTLYGLLESGWVIPSVPGIIAFTCIDY